MRTFALLSLGVLSLCGCQEDTAKKATVAGDKQSPAAKDNSAINERDRSGTTKTPIDQNENQLDINVTSDIRKRVVAEKGFSIDAQNVKIITADGKVTLRGPVKNQKERDDIEAIARDIAGKNNVDNKIEVTP